MDAPAETALFLFVSLVLLSGAAGLGAWLGVRLLRRRSPSQRPWGGRHYARVRNKYFEKERRARDQRARRARETGPPPAADPDVPGPVDLDRLHRATLGLDGELTVKAIKLAYRERMWEYHPDRVAGLGVKLRRMAEEETKRINEAYVYFRQRYGF